MAEPGRGSDLHDSLDELVRDTKDLAKTYKEAEHVRRIKTTVMLALLVVAAVLTAFTLLLGLRVSRIASKIDSCTSPTGQCYLDQRARTGSAVDLIVHGQVYVAECARVTTDDEALEKCVTAKYEAAKEASGR